MGGASDMCMSSVVFFSSPDRCSPTLNTDACRRRDDMRLEEKTHSDVIDRRLSDTRVEPDGDRTHFTNHQNCES